MLRRPGRRRRNALCRRRCCILEGKARTSLVVLMEGGKGRGHTMFRTYEKPNRAPERMGTI
jgi:hypothetical protein